jgi:transposase
LGECGADELWRGLLHSALAASRHLVGLFDAAEGRLDKLAQQDQGVQLLETVPGVGPRTAEAIVAHLHQPERFSTGKQVSAYVGLVPKQFQSGETDRRGRISRRGPALLRKLPVECAWVMLRYNQPLRQTGPAFLLCRVQRSLRLALLLNCVVMAQARPPPPVCPHCSSRRSAKARFGPGRRRQAESENSAWVSTQGHSIVLS